MILPRMNRPRRVILLSTAAAALAVVASACGTERINIPKSDPSHASDAYAAQLFQERCAGCHTLSYAATHGSAANPRTAEAINGPNFNVRCERPVTRVLYAIENGGFSGAYMPQNVFVGEQARQVAMFVARFAGRQAPRVPGVPICQTQPIGTLPALPTASAVASLTATTATTTAAATPAYGHKKKKKK